MAQYYVDKEKMSEKEIKIFPTVEELNNFAANEFVRLAAEAINKREQFTVALSGGSTPKKLNTLLASDSFRTKIDWTKVHFFFGDERNVPPDDAESNYRMANETLLSKIDIAPENIHRFLTEEGEAKTVAEKMESDLKSFFSLTEEKSLPVLSATDSDDPQINFPRFDLIFLGMGPDGHTASLFPETFALEEDNRIVVENYVPKFDTFRLTFTFPTINNSRNIIFLIAGEDKAESLNEVLNGKANRNKFPSQGISPNNGSLLFLIDQKAAANII